jgi:hypothetical protein
MATATPPFAHRMTTPLRQTWKGLWLLGVAVVHTVFAVVVFQPQMREIVERGVFDSVGTDPMRGAVSWFVLFGGLFALLGWAVMLVERQAALAPVPLRALGAGLLALALLGIVLMPASGFWLVLPPALALCLQPRQQ